MPWSAVGTSSNYHFRYISDCVSYFHFQLQESVTGVVCMWSGCNHSFMWITMMPRLNDEISHSDTTYIYSMLMVSHLFPPRTNDRDWWLFRFYFYLFLISYSISYVISSSFFFGLLKDFREIITIDESHGLIYTRVHRKLQSHCQLESTSLRRTDCYKDEGGNSRGSYMVPGDGEV